MNEYSSQKHTARTHHSPGTLYLCGTPIGNLEDMSQRAIRILSSVHTIAAEDTRHTRKLLNAFDIKTPLVSLHEHNEAARTPQVIELLESGQDVALVSDAGMPGISDPGEQLVRACIEAGLSVVPIPGPTAFVAGLVAGGLPTDRFCFEGFLPRQAAQRTERLHQVKELPHTLIFYEAPHRLASTLQAIYEALGDRMAVLAREITKLHEEYVRGPLSHLIRWCEEGLVRGEFVILVEGAKLSQARPQISDEKLQEHLRGLLETGLSMRDAVRAAAEQFDLPRRHVYNVGLRMKDA